MISTGYGKQMIYGGVQIYQSGYFLLLPPLLEGGSSGSRHRGVAHSSISK